MNDVTLFDYQAEMLAQIDRAFERHRSVMVQMPTGTGKTHLLAAVVMEEVRDVVMEKTPPEGYPCVWIVAHRRELVVDRKSTRLNSSHSDRSRMPSSA